MKAKQTRVIARMAIALVCLTLAAGSTLAFEPKVGEPLADFTLPRIDNGEPASLSDYRGRKVLLIMFASW